MDTYVTWKLVFWSFHELNEKIGLLLARKSNVTIQDHDIFFYFFFVFFFRRTPKIKLLNFVSLSEIIFWEGWNAKNLIRSIVLYIIINCMFKLPGFILGYCVNAYTYASSFQM